MNFLDHTPYTLELVDEVSQNDPPSHQTMPDPGTHSMWMSWVMKCLPSTLNHTFYKLRPLDSQHVDEVGHRVPLPHTKPHPL